MGPRPDGHSIDRIDVNKGYSPDNCRWATRTVQNRNFRTTRKVEISGEEYIAADLADINGMKIDTIILRARQGLSFSEVISASKRVYDISAHSGDKAGVRKRLERSRSRSKCKNGHPWPEFQRINKVGAVECVQCAREKSLRSQRRKRGLG